MKGKSSLALLFLTGSLAFSFLLASFSPTYYRSSAATTIEEARANTNVNLVSGGEISDNIRDSYDNGMSYSDGTYTMISSGTWLHSRTLITSDLIDQESVLLNNVETSTKNLDVYYSGDFKFTNYLSGKFAGFIIGRATLSSGESVYLSVDMIPFNKQISFYYYKKIGGEADLYQVIDITGVTFAANFKYTLEVLKCDESCSIYINNKLVSTVSEVTSNSGTGSGTPETLLIKDIIPAVGADFCDIDCTLTNLTMKYLNEGQYAPVIKNYPDLDYARTYNSEDVYQINKVNASGNKRDPYLNGFTFENNVATMTYSGSWLRAVNAFTNDVFDSNELILNDDSIVSTKGVPTYYKAKFKITNKEENRILGLIIGKTKVLNQNSYISINICPKNNFVALYTYTTKPYDFTYQITSNFNIAINQEYLMEVVMLDGMVELFIDGVRYAQIGTINIPAYLATDVVATIDFDEVIPAFGTNFMDIDASIFDFSFKYLTEYRQIKVFIEPTYPDDSPDVYHYNTEIIEPDIKSDEKINKMSKDSIVKLSIGIPVASVGIVGLIIVLIIYKTSKKKGKELL